MSLLKGLKAGLVGRKRLQNDLDDELRFHLEKQIEQNRAAGMDAGEARRQALISFGGVQKTREDVGETRWRHFWEVMLQDVRYSSRMLRKTPGFTAIAVLTLGLGIGLNTAIFSLIDAVLFRTLPVSDANELVVLQWQSHGEMNQHGYSNFGACEERGNQQWGCSFSLPFFREIEANAEGFSGLAGFTPAGAIALSGDGQPAGRINAEYVSGGYFPTLGIRAAAGRLISPGDDLPGSQPAIVLNYAYWQSAFGGAQSAIGKTVKVNSLPFTIVGVAEPRFTSLLPGSNQRDIWIPLAQRPRIEPGWDLKRDAANYLYLAIVGRLKPGVHATQAQEGVSLRFRDESISGPTPLFKPGSQAGVKLAPAATTLHGIRDRTLQPLYVLMMCVGIVLLIACANVAGLMLARSVARAREIAVRLTLGARRSRLLFQLLTESLLLSVLGGALGLLFSIWGARALLLLVNKAQAGALDLTPQLDWRVLGFTAAATIVTGILFGLAPAIRALRTDPAPALKSGAIGAVSGEKRRRFGLGDAIVGIQVALSLIVLVSAGLLVHTLSNLKNLDPGFDPRNLLLFGLDPRMAGYKDAQVDHLYSEVQEKLAALPGVRSVSYSWRPLLGGGRMNTAFSMPGGKEDVTSDMLPVGPGFFSNLRIPVLAGRDFIAMDFTTAAANSGEKPSAVPDSVIVNQTFARTYFPNVNPIGQRFGQTEAKPGSNEPASPGWVVVGVAGDAKYNQLTREIDPTMYVPNSGGEVFFELRTAGDPNQMVATVRQSINKIDGNLAVFKISTQSEQIAQLVYQEKLIAQLSSLFGGLALALACLGLYGLLSYEVNRRTREIGIRMAIGAQRYDVVRMVLQHGVLLVLIGAIIGVGASFGVSQLLGSLLYGVRAGDPYTLAAAGALLLAIAAAASWLPARRATRVDPLVALRYE